MVITYGIFCADGRPDDSRVRAVHGGRREELQSRFDGVFVANVWGSKLSRLPAGELIYSYRKTIIGSTFVALQVGTRHAIKATATSNSDMPMKVIGSVALTP